MGHDQLYDALISDGLTDAFHHQHMGVFADRCAETFGFTRRQQDDFAVRSHTRARTAIEAGIFAPTLRGEETPDPSPPQTL